MQICIQFSRFKRFDNRFIRPLLLRDHQGAEPKILETYSKLAMKDAMDYMRRNASTIGNISGTESMSAIFRNYTAGNINGNLSGTLNGRLVQVLVLFFCN
jgi:sodium/hydrogen exchanger-like protein 3